MSPALGHGKVCYIQIPAVDVETSARFYAAVFGWNVRQNSQGHTSFDDGVGEVSGAWVTDRPPMTEAGLLFYIMVNDAELSIEAIKAYGGRIVQGIGGDEGEITARFTDPSGNLLGIYQEPS
jgi:uncharacterized protein